MNSLYLLLLFFSIITTSTATPASRPLTPLHAAGTVPDCYPIRPYCIRPRVEECRDAIMLMGAIDPGYPVIVGRKEIVSKLPRSFDVPRMWSSLPVNCIVRIDVRDPKSTDETTLKVLTIAAELIVRKCIIKGTGCGGSILAGKSRGLVLKLSYYTDLSVHGIPLGPITNITDLAHTDS
ncbi:MAG: hypothetical protein L6R40_008076 [Gallowayella cf. fulva]|nr:MAG: hypothetical protein L6R40_008076 [Xanthomendoza cf. fulva]